MSDLESSDTRAKRTLPLPALSTAASDPILMRIVAYYGPTAFGLVCFLAIWFTAVRPTLDNNRVDTRTIQQIADTMRQTAQMLVSVTERLERLERRISPP